MPVYTQKQWNSFYPAFKSLSPSTINTAYRVLVSGESLSDVAKDNDVSRQQVHATVKRVRKKLINFDEHGLVPVEIWVNESCLSEARECLYKITQQ